MIASFVCIQEDHPKGQLYGKTIHKFGRCLATWVGERTAGADMAHLLDVRMAFFCNSITLVRI